jgi:hypothetical protein
MGSGYLYMPQLLTKSLLYSLAASSFLLLPKPSFSQVQAHMIPMQAPSQNSGGPSSGCPSCSVGAPGGGLGAGVLGAAAGGLGARVLGAPGGGLGAGIVGAAAGMVAGGRGPLNAINNATNFALPLLAVAATTGKGRENSGASVSTTTGASGASGANTNASSSAPKSGEGPLSFGPAAGKSVSTTKR